MNLPNKLSLLRIFLIPLMLITFYVEALPVRFIITAVIFALAAFTDFLDGYIARKYNMVTDFGKFIDPIADKILVLSAFVIMLTNPIILSGPLGYTFGAVIGGVGVTIIVAREMTVSVLRMIAAEKGIVLAAEKIGKLKTLVTDFAIILLFVTAELKLICLGTVYVVFYYISLALYLISVILTIYSGIFYLVKNKELFKQCK